MGRRPYPSISIIVSGVSYQSAETALDNLAELENFREKHSESKLEKSKHNGTKQVDGYIKRELEYTENTDFTLSATFTTKDEELEVEYTGSMNEDTRIFSEISKVFEENIYPILNNCLVENVPDPKVTTTSI